MNEKLLPVNGASIHILNTQFFAISDKEGKFSIQNVDKGPYIINVSSIGYATINRKINFDGINEIEFNLQSSFKQLSELTITTQKRDELLQTASLSVTSLSAEQVRDYRLWNINDLTAIPPNLYTADPGDKRNVTSLRGIVSTSYDPAVATYIDGVSQFGLDTYISQLFDVERIEIARGPQGTLYGRNAMGGVINIITKKPENKFSGFVEASLGNYGRQRLTGGIKIPVIKDRLFFGAAALMETTDGFYKNLFNNSSYDKQHSTSGNYYLKYLGKKLWSFTLNLKHTANRNNGAFPLVFGIDKAFEDPFTLNQNAITKMIDNIFNTSLSVIHNGRSLNFSSQTSYQSNYRYYKNPIDADFSPLDRISIINNYGKTWNHVNVFTQEFRLSSDRIDETKFNWTTGTYLFYQHNPVKQTTRFGNDAKLLGMPDSNFSLINTSTANNKGIAFFGQANYNLTKKFVFTAGLRYDYELKQQSILGEYQKDPDPIPLFALRSDTSASSGFNSFSPKLSLAFHPSSSGMFFITYNKGFRAGGLTPLSSDPSQPPLISFKPETSNNIEAGIKNTLFDKKVAFNFTIFYSGISNVQVPTLVLPEAVTIIRNTGKLRSKGIELEAKSVSDGLELDYSFGYTNATYSELKISQNGAEINLQGKHQQFTPDVTSMLAAQYTILMSEKRGFKLFVRGEWRYLGKQYFDLSNTIAQSPYQIINVNLGLTLKKLSLNLWARNLNDARYISYAYDFGAVHLGNPRTYGATITIRL